jgi:hypothetical protein
LTGRCFCAGSDACSGQSPDCCGLGADGHCLDMTKGETQSNGDINNCGACGATCKQNLNTLASCNGGECSRQCANGYADCQGTIDTPQGCQTNISNDANNCGACGHQCQTPDKNLHQILVLNSSGGPICKNGNCQVTCAPGYVDCDTSKPGCETSESVDHCGPSCMSCKISPGTHQGSAACGAFGQCLFACQEGWLDCGSDTTCSTPRDGNNCFGCGQPCPIQFGASATSCSREDVPCDDRDNCWLTTYLCGYTCNSGFQNCNGGDPNHSTDTDGCEINTLNDANNCGGCGNSCPSGVCDQGVCIQQSL